MLHCKCEIYWSKLSNSWFIYNPTDKEVYRNIELIENGWEVFNTGGDPAPVLKIGSIAAKRILDHRAAILRVGNLHDNMNEGALKAHFQVTIYMYSQQL